MLLACCAWDACALCGPSSHLFSLIILIQRGMFCYAGSADGQTPKLDCYNTTTHSNIIYEVFSSIFCLYCFASIFIFILISFLFGLRPIYLTDCNLEQDN